MCSQVSSHLLLASIGARSDPDLVLIETEWIDAAVTRVRHEQHSIAIYSGSGAGKQSQGI